MNGMLEELKKICREALESGKVEAIIAWKRKKSEPREVLTVIKRPEEVDGISLSPLSANNPARLAMELAKSYNKLGVVAKGCDAMAIRQLIIEEKIDRDKLYIIGVSCPGVVDYRKLARDFKPSEIESVELAGEKLIIKMNGSKKEVAFKDYIFENCLYCSHPTPVEYDVLIGKPRSGFVGYDDISEIENMSEEERWKYWQEQFALCIRCHACRSVCPLCYCEECIVDPTSLAISPMSTAEEKAAYPRILGRWVSASDNLIYHLVRVLHHAGRCAGCGECERACPMGLPLRKLERKLEKVVREVFGYKIGEEDVPFPSKLDIVG